MRYFELQDAGPPKNDVASLVKIAAERLEAIEKIDSELYVNALQSSALLCLADARAISPYHNFSRKLSREELLVLNKQLKLLGLAIFTEGGLPGVEPFDTTVFSYLNMEVLKGIPGRYKFLTDASYSVLEDGTNDLLTAVTFEAQNHQLAKLMSEDSLPKAWLKDWWAPHNLRFGMQLGYPGSAISAFLWNESEGREETTEIHIDDKNEFDGPWVAFGIAPGHEQSADTQNIVNVWTEIIRQIRKRVPVAEVLAQQKFKEAARAIAD